MAYLQRNVSKLCLGSLSNFGLRGISVRPQQEQVLDLGQGESQLLRALDEADPASNVRVEDAVASLGSGCGCQQFLTFVAANRLKAYATLFR